MIIERNNKQEMSFLYFFSFIFFNVEGNILREADDVLK